MKKALIVGNCQSAELARILNLCCTDLSFQAFEVHLVSPDDITSLGQRIKDYSLILSMPLSESFGALSRPALAAASDNVLFYTNVHFEGFHPDFTFIGTLVQRCLGPLGNYHSRIALHAFPAGLAVGETVPLFAGETYRRLGYESAFARSEQVFRYRDSDNDIRFSDAFFELAKRERVLLTFNHPTTVTFYKQARLIIDFLASRGLCDPGSFFDDPWVYENSLVSGPALPIYPELAEHMGLPRSDGYVFKTAPGRGRASIFIGLQQFVEEEFACFAEMPDEWLRSTPQAARQDDFVAMLQNNPKSASVI